MSYNKRQMSRIYPRGGRVDSSNYLPQVRTQGVAGVAFLQMSVTLIVSQSVRPSITQIVRQSVTQSLSQTVRHTVSQSLN